jgi:uncharacterized protein (TIGR04255 family)
VPGHPFGVQVIQTIQPVPGPVKEVGLILDIDAFTMSPFDFSIEGLKNRLSQLRWLKNKAFFGSFKQETMERFR